MLYEIIYADFPWPYTSYGTAKLPYLSMTEAEIASFDWSRFCAKSCVVFSWMTAPKMDVAFRCAEEWKRRHGLHFQGIPYVWVKTRQDGAPLGASGVRPRLVKPTVEYCAAFSTTKGKRTFPLLTESQRNTVFSPKDTLHSRKPEEVRQNIVSLLGNRPRIELFARERSDGWDAWGHEVAPVRKIGFRIKKPEPTGA